MLPNFVLHRPTGLAEACRLKERGGVPFAGGTDVFAAMHGGEARHGELIDLKGVEELSGMRFSPVEGATLGALTTHRAVENWEPAGVHYAALREGCSRVGSPQTRCRGTLGGNLCNAAPSGDSIGPLAALGAVLEIAGEAGRRAVPVESFFSGAKRTVLAAGELLARILLPPPAPDSGSAYYKYSRRAAMDLALIGIAAWVRLENGVIAEARIALGTCAPTVMRASDAETALAGKAPGDGVFSLAGKLAREQANPRTSWRAAREFRLALIERLTPRVLAAACRRARGEEQP